MADTSRCRLPDSYAGHVWCDANRAYARVGLVLNQELDLVDGLETMIVRIIAARKAETKIESYTEDAVFSSCFAPSTKRGDGILAGSAERVHQ